MIIVCPECSTKFKVDSDRIPDGGAKVRCARCQHVFLAEKPPEQESPLLEEVETFHGESAADSLEQQASPDERFAAPPTEESDFSYDKFQELDSSTAETETFTFGGERETEENFTFTESTEEPVSTIEKVFAAENSAEAIAEPVVEEETVNQSPVVKKASTTPESQPQPAPERKGGPVSSLIRILLLLILGILIIGGVFVYMNGTDQLNQTIQQIFGQQVDQPVQTGQITLSELEGKFIQNEQDGELFLIRGEAINNFAEPRAAIQVKGVIFDQNGKPLLQKTIFCGNPIDDQKLLSLSFLELEKIMGNQFGKELSNMKIDSKKSIPFDIVFKDLPKNLSEFSVKVTASQPATE